MGETNEKLLFCMITHRYVIMRSGSFFDSTPNFFRGGMRCRRA
ncbi:MAG: hypothetical protein WBI07_12855 [Mobilitalea sp.]